MVANGIRTSGRVDRQTVNISGEELKNGNNFTYLGTVVSMKIRHRVSVAWVIWKKWSGVLWCARQMLVMLKGKIQNSGNVSNGVWGQRHGQQRKAKKREWM